MADSTKFSVTKLNDSNYFNWAFKMELLLIKEDLWSVVEQEKPDSPGTAWLKKDQEARIIIGLSVEDPQLCLIRKSKSAKESWDAIKEHYMKDTLSNQVRLIRRICSTKLEEGGNMDKHIKKMNEYFQQLQAMGEETLTEKWSVAFLLSSLPESYDSIVTALESRPQKELTLNLVEAKLLDDYARREQRAPSNEESALKVVMQKPQARTCYFCKEVGHIRRHCEKYKDWLKQKNNNKANIVQDEEYLFSFGDLKDGWTIDSGASVHISNKKKEFCELDETFHEKLKLANGKFVEVKGKGSVKIDLINSKDEKSTAKIENVLWVPECEGNLISVKKLTEKGFQVSFGKECCKIMDKSREIAVANLKKSLYKLKESPKINEKNWRKLSYLTTQNQNVGYEIQEEYKKRKQNKFDGKFGLPRYGSRKKYEVQSSTVVG